jgi:hypothetical protein
MVVPWTQLADRGAHSSSVVGALDPRFVVIDLPRFTGSGWRVRIRPGTPW